VMSACTSLSLVAIFVRRMPRIQDQSLRRHDRHARRRVLILCKVFHTPVAATDPEDALKAVVRSRTHGVVSASTPRGCGVGVEIGAGSQLHELASAETTRPESSPEPAVHLSVCRADLGVSRKI
jgi:hypothetical protein